MLARYLFIIGLRVNRCAFSLVRFSHHANTFLGGFFETRATATLPFRSTGDDAIIWSYHPCNATCDSSSASVLQRTMLDYRFEDSYSVVSDDGWAGEPPSTILPAEWFLTPSIIEQVKQNSSFPAQTYYLTNVLPNRPTLAVEDFQMCGAMGQPRALQSVPIIGSSAFRPVLHGDVSIEDEVVRM
jgi:hypothetical protein